jgi:hypothetical protein
MVIDSQVNNEAWGSPVGAYFGAWVGAGIGGVIDRTVNRSIYSRPRQNRVTFDPVIGAGRLRVALSVSF